MADKRIRVYSVKFKEAADKRIRVYAVRFKATPPDKRIRVYSVKVKMPADGNRPVYWKDGGTLHGAVLLIKHGGVGGTLEQIT